MSRIERGVDRVQEMNFVDTLCAFGLPNNRACRVEELPAAGG
jgi:hypothetical protein